MRETIKLDGRTLEGGGQLLRNGICLSALTGMPVEIHNIRGNRSSGGGLKAQHLACVNWLALACDAETIGNERGSKTLVFIPRTLGNRLSPAYIPREGRAGAFDSIVDIGTAGSTGLVLQAVLPYILFAPPRNAAADGNVQLRVSGGTNVSGSPSYEYITQVLLPTLSAIGLGRITARLESRGWSTGRATSGSFVLDIPIVQPRVLPSFELRPPDCNTKPARPGQLQVTFLGPRSCHEHLSIVLIPAVRHYFGESTGNLSITCEDSGNDKRLYLIIVAIVPTPSTSKVTEYRLARDWLYDRKVRSVERAVTEMSERVTADIYDEWRSGAWVDEQMRDQLVIFQALSEPRSTVWPGRHKDGERRKPSLHARTAEWVSKEMVGVHFGADDACEGIGFAVDTEDRLATHFTSMKIDA